MRFRIGLSYLRGAKPDAAEAHFEALAAALPPPLRAEAELQRGYARYLAKDLTGADFLLSQWLQAFGDQAPAPDRARAHYLLGWTRLARGDGPAARVELGAAPFPGQPSLLAAAGAMDELPYRSPLVAGMLSLVPGAGHLYLGQPLIAVSAFLWNGLFGFGLADSIRNHQVGVAVVLGLFEALWYAGTIFGAIDGAQKFNRDARLNALDALRSRYDDRPESWPPAP